MKVFITGSSRGLGEAFVNHYLNEGAEVYGLGRSEVLRSDYRYRQVDVSDSRLLEKELSQMFETVEKLDLVLLNAGVLGRIQDISLCSTQQLKKEMDINMWANKTILDFFIKKGIRLKQVIAISSGASVNGSLGWNGYSLSKAALNMLIKLYAAEMQDTHLSSLAPGLIGTEMLEGILRGDHDTRRYSSVQSLRESEANGLVLSPKEIVEKISLALPELLKLQSGLFIDFRDMETKAL